MRTPIPLCMLVLLLVGGGCGGEAETAAPHAGDWVGNHVLFRVQTDGRITDVWTRDVACSGQRDGGLPCTARFNAALAGEVVPVAGVFDAPLGPIRFAGRFVSAVEAAGVLHFADPDGCCADDIAWTASYRPAEFPDAAAPDAAARNHRAV